MSGVGRGREWLNIKRKQQAPGGILTTKTATEVDPIQKFLGYIENISDIPSKYVKAFQEFETISDKKTLLVNLADYQYNDDDIYQCVLLLVQKYLVDWNMGFQSIENAYYVNRVAVLNSAQNIFENREYLFKKNKLALVKLMIMLSKFYVLMKVFFTAAAVFECSKHILEPVHNEYIPTFARCLHQIFNSNDVVSSTGKKLPKRPIINVKTCYQNAFDSHIVRMLGQLRAAICTIDDTTTRYWLYLAREIIDSGSQILPEETLEFYTKHLGQEEIKYFRQVVNNETTTTRNVSNETYKPDIEIPLYLDTNQSLQSLDKHISGVRVLKIDDSLSSQKNENDEYQVEVGANINVADTDRIISAASINQQHNSNSTHNPLPSPITADTHPPPMQKQHNHQQLAYQQQQTSGGGGRAILGSGARNNSVQPPHKHSPRYDLDDRLVNGLRVEQRGERQYGSDRVGTSRPPPPDVSRSHSAWNHDDRC